MAGRRRKTQSQPSKTTADYLAQAVFDDLFPEHPQTCADYGFDRAVTPEEKSNLLGLYIGLIKFSEVSPKTIHDWRIRGVLVDQIKATFCKTPEGARGAYFPWFLQNQHIVALAGKPLSAKEMRDHGDAMLLRTWRFAGGSEKDSVQEVKAAIQRKSVAEQKCYNLYTLLLSRWSPSPNLELWVDFGFASCTSEAEESELGCQYQFLITRCTFNEFCTAYGNRRLLDLFHSNGLQAQDNAQLRDLLSGHPGVRKSVWHLKQFAMQEAPAGGESGAVPSVMVDYGFINCKNVSETRQLKKMYKEFFTTHRGDPLALHEACIKGTLYPFLSNIIQGLHGPKYQRLMKNLYPLQDLDDSLSGDNDSGRVQADETDPDTSNKSSSGDNDGGKVQADGTRQVPPLPDPDLPTKSSGDNDGGSVPTDAPPPTPPALHSAVLFASGAVFGAVLAVLWMQARSS